MFRHHLEALRTPRNKFNRALRHRADGRASSKAGGTIATPHLHSVCHSKVWRPR
jgi:hypothetical protein